MPTSTTLERVIGQDVTLVASKLATGATALTNWTEIDCEVVIKEYELTAAAAKGEQFRPGRKKATGTVSGFVGSTETPGSLPREGDELKTLHVQTVTEGADLLYDLFTDTATFGKIIVTKTSYKQGDDGGKWSFSFRSGGM